MIEFYQKHSINLFINVSTTEGVPVSIMEALSFGIPVFATNVGGSSELVNKNVGKLLDVNFDVLTVSKELDNFLELNGNALKVYRDNAYQQYKDLADAEKNYNEFYNSIIL